MIERCPGCGGELVVSRMDCRQCHTGLEGAFRPSSFDRLSPESLAFVELFVRSKGNLKELERALSLPYSTVRHRLDEVVRELGAAPPADAPATAPALPTAPAPAAPPAPPAAARRQILGRLDRGEITPEEAIRLLGGAP